jgi:hypothetical protein
VILFRIGRFIGWIFESPTLSFSGEDSPPVGTVTVDNDLLGQSANKVDKTLCSGVVEINSGGFVETSS